MIFLDQFHGYSGCCCTMIGRQNVFTLFYFCYCCCCCCCIFLILLMFYKFFYRILLHLECIAFWTCAASMNYRLCTLCWIKDRGSSFILCMRTIPSITSLRGKFDEHRLRQIISFVLIVDNKSFLFEVTSDR